MKLSQSVTYAVHAALRLAAKLESGPVPCGQIAEQGHMPERFLLQILRDMSKQGILHSTRGGGGGFMLERDPAEISLLQLIEAVEGPMSAGLPINVSLPEQSRSRLQDTLRRITDTTRDQLGAVKLTDLMEMPVVVGEVVGAA
ncbi:MAG TPA: Rrf2 family transcriptional regulator [Thermoguttaceae bacterium]|nr:Rrf2 family transcriptional regulator [Thermoguttaceae bacterium]